MCVSTAEGSAVSRVRVVEIISNRKIALKVYSFGNRGTYSYLRSTHGMNVCK